MSLETPLVYQGKKRDTHSFVVPEGNTFGQPHDSYSFFFEPEFDNTDFLVIAPYASQNESVYEKMLRTQKFTGQHLMLNPEPENVGSFTKELPKEIEMMAEREHIVGLKSHPGLVKFELDDPAYRPYLETAAKNGITLLLHCGASTNIHATPEMFRKVLESPPWPVLIAAHLGGLNPEYAEQMIRLGEDHPNLYFNTTALIDTGRNFRQEGTRAEWVLHPERVRLLGEMESLFLDAYQRFGDRILFGSDEGYRPKGYYSYWPVNQLTHEGQKKVLHDNAGNLWQGKMKQ